MLRVIFPELTNGLTFSFSQVEYRALGIICALNFNVSHCSSLTMQSFNESICHISLSSTLKLYYVLTYNYMFLKPLRRFSQKYTDLPDILKLLCLRQHFIKIQYSCNMFYFSVLPWKTT